MGTTLYQLSPTSRRPILGLNLTDEFKFKKFRDKLKSRSTELNSTTLTVFDSPMKLENIAQENFPDVIKTKEIISTQENLSEIIEPSVSKKQAKPKPEETNENINKQNHSSFEEGEIISDDDDDVAAAAAADDDDDDCVFIEEEIEEIIIDDTENDIAFFEDTNKMPFIDLTPQGHKVSPRKSHRKSSPSLSSNIDDVVVLDDTIVDANAKPPITPKNIMDASVVFVSETLPDYIPLVSDNVPKPLNNSSNPFSKREKHFRDSLFSTSEKKELKSYNVNAYNPNAAMEREQRQKNPKRMVIIDGSNVAYAHSRKQVFSVKGLQICIEYFKKMGHEVKAVIPLYRLHKLKSTDPNALEAMHRDGIIVLTPCKNLPGLSSSSYDDRFILQLASELDAAIVSNDNYRDLINENSAFEKLIKNRVIGYTWCDDVFMLPKDPYGHFGPTLHSILNRQIVERGS